MGALGFGGPVYPWLRHVGVAIPWTLFTPHFSVEKKRVHPRTQQNLERV